MLLLVLSRLGMGGYFYWNNNSQSPLVWVGNTNAAGVTILKVYNLGFWSVSSLEFSIVATIYPWFSAIVLNWFAAFNWSFTWFIQMGPLYMTLRNTMDHGVRNNGDIIDTESQKHYLHYVIDHDGSIIYILILSDGRSIVAPSKKTPFTSLHIFRQL